MDTVDNYPPDESRKWEEQAHLGDRFNDFLNNGAYGLLNENVLKPMEDGAFSAFMDIPADNTIGIIETQMMSKLIRKIRSTIESFVQEGRLATEKIKQLSQDYPEEDV